MRARIHIDRLVLDGLPDAVRPADLERAIRAALTRSMAGAEPRRSASVPELRLSGRNASVESAAADVADAVTRQAGGRR